LHSFRATIRSALRSRASLIAVLVHHRPDAAGVPIKIPFTMVQMIEAIIVMAVASSEFFIRHRIRWIR